MSWMAWLLAAMAVLYASGTLTMTNPPKARRKTSEAVFILAVLGRVAIIAAFVLIAREVA